MTFFEQTRKIESRINCLDGRTREAKNLKNLLTVLWQNASSKDLSDYALFLVITDEPVMELLNGTSDDFQEVFRRYIKSLEITEKIRKRILQK